VTVEIQQCVGCGKLTGCKPFEVRVEHLGEHFRLTDMHICAACDVFEDGREYLRAMVRDRVERQLARQSEAKQTSR
jgi:hypothetical protein